MGRIAEALKRADEERASTIGLAGTDAAGTAPAEPGIDGSARAEPEIGSDRLNAPMAAETGLPPAPADGRRICLDRVSTSLVALHGQDSILVEQYRALRTRLSSQPPRTRPRAMVITSSTAGEGKTVTAANLGVVMAEVRHHRVLLLDADFRRGNLAGLFGLDPEPGLVEVLEGKRPVEEVVQRTPVPNLHLIAAGGAGDVNHAELLSSKRAAAVFDDLRDRYSYLLIDTPPSSDVADAGIVGQLADGVLMVIRMGETPQPVVKRIVQSLQASHVNLIGCILTCADEFVSPYSDYSNYPSESGA